MAAKNFFRPINSLKTQSLTQIAKEDRYYSRVSALLHTMIAKNRRPDIFTELCKRTMRHEGFRIFNDLKDRGIGNLEEAKELYHEMCCKGYKETTVSCNTMIRGLCLHERTEKAHVLFEEMAEKGIARDIITYNSLIPGFCKEGKIDESINLLAKFLEKGLRLSAATYTAHIEKICEMGDVDEAKELWEDMQKRGVEPAVCTCNFIITRLSNKGYVAEGMEWLAAMLRRYTLRECIFRSLVDKLCEQNSDHVETCLGVVQTVNFMLKITITKPSHASTYSRQDFE
ncbi:hypothetical protein HYC85_020324 [Camellia sinensis]|uniref:Pentacotripeptide-repeat region of PRORP domain-containing protein n=1 Tax=Camellia sinensis TaxID=4442 RepID=A0A7J7GPF5_CAMSI|nr:hypothetical protein HYC85_020324 [Camellia sinensis]